MLALTRLGKVRRGEGEDGQATIETAISMILAFISVFWLFELTMYCYTLSVLNEAAHEGVRYAMFHGSNAGNNVSGCSTSAPSDAIAVVKNLATSLSLHDITAMTVNVCYPEGSTPSSLVTMTVTYTYVPYITLPGIIHIMQVSSQGRIVY